MHFRWNSATVWGVALLAFAVPARAEIIVDKAIIVSRHGVRPPTNQKTLNPLSVDPWPSWSVPDGDLTPHGAAAAELMGRYYRSRLSKAGLLDAGQCPSAREVFAWADKADRTRLTADALLEGLHPGCGLKAGVNEQTASALFHPVVAGVAKVDQDAARQGIMKALGGSIDAGKARYAREFGRLAKTLHGPTQAACAKAKLQAGCSLIDLPWTLASISDGRSITLRGPLNWASTIGEVIRMEYANDFPLDRVAWGRIADAEEVKSVLALHKAYYDVTLRVPAIARPSASQILNQVSLSLRDGTAMAKPGGPPSAKVVLFVGHDTNIATMQAAMSVRWSLPGYPENDTPPGGAFLFERLRDVTNGLLSVRLSYLAQSLDQIRNLMPLTDASEGPEVAVLTLPGCPPAPASCSLEIFSAGLETSIDQDALGPISYQPEIPHRKTETVD